MAVNLTEAQVDEEQGRYDQIVLAMSQGIRNGIGDSLAALENEAALNELLGKQNGGAGAELMKLSKDERAAYLRTFWKRFNGLQCDVDWRNDLLVPARTIVAQPHTFQNKGERWELSVGASFCGVSAGFGFKY